MSKVLTVNKVAEHNEGALGVVVGVDGQQVAEHDEGALGARKPRGLLRLWQQRMLELRIAELPSLARELLPRAPLACVQNQLSLTEASFDSVS